MTQAEQIALVARDLPMLPQVAWDVMTQLKHPDTSAQDLQKVIARDQALAARVLKISNSAIFGVRGLVSSLSHAVVILGLQTLKSLVLAAASESLFRGRSLKDKLLWDHALGVSLTAQWLAQNISQEDPHEAFVAGLLHDVGKPVLDNQIPDLYQAVVERVYNEGRGFLQAERELLSFDHAEVGALVAEKWNLSPRLRDAIRYHHDPAACPENAAFCATIELANAICVKNGIGPERHPDLDLNQLASVSILRLDSARLKEIEERIVEQVLSGFDTE